MAAYGQRLLARHATLLSGDDTGKRSEQRSVDELLAVLVGAGVLEWSFQARPIGIIAVMANLGVSIIQRTRADQHQLGTLSAQLRP